MWMISLNFKEVGKTIPDDSSQMITGKGNEKGRIRCISIVHLVCVNFELKLMSKDPTLSDKCEKAGQVFVEFPTLERGGDVQLPKESYAHTNEETSHRIFLKCRSEGNIAWRNKQKNIHEGFCEFIKLPLLRCDLSRGCVTSKQTRPGNSSKA